MKFVFRSVEVDSALEEQLSVLALVKPNQSTDPSEATGKQLFFSSKEGNKME